MTKQNKILILTNKEDITADYVVLELQERNIPYFRFNTEDFPENVTGSLHLNGSRTSWSFQNAKGIFDLDEICSIWYRRPGIPRIHEKVKDLGVREFCRRESQEFLEGIWPIFKGLWVSYPPRIFHAQNKLYQLHLARNLGFKVPDTLITNDPKKVRNFVEDSRYAVVTKAVRQGILEIGGKEHIIFTNPVGEKDLKAVSDIRFSPSIFQEYIPKEFDVRITVIGRKVFPVEIHTSTHVPNSEFDWRRGDQETLSYNIHKLPEEIEHLCRKLVQKTKLEFGAIDLVYSRSGKYYFLEINPNGQWAWIEQKTGIGLTGALVDLLTGIETCA